MLVLRRAVACAMAGCLPVSGCVISDDLSPEDGGAVSYYQTSGFRGNRLLSLIAFEGGLVYGFYQSDFAAPVFPEYAYAGFFVARPQSGDDASPKEGMEFDFDAHTAIAVTLAASITSGDKFSGVLRGSTDRQPDTIFAARSSVSDIRTNTTTLGGDYDYQARSPRGSFVGVSTVSAEMTLHSQYSADCTVEAALRPRPLGNLYAVTAQIGPACSVGNGSFSGYGVQAYATGNVYLLLTNATGEGIMLLLTRR